jgi:cyclin H
MDFRPQDSVTPTAETARKEPLYEASTQLRNWRFSPEGLAVIRAKLNDVAVAAIRHTFEVDQVTIMPIFKSFTLNLQL